MLQSGRAGGSILDAQRCDITFELAALGHRLLCEHDLGAGWSYDQGIFYRAAPVLCQTDRGVFGPNVTGGPFPRFLNNGTLHVDEWAHAYPSTPAAQDGMTHLLATGTPCGWRHGDTVEPATTPTGPFPQVAQLHTWTLSSPTTMPGEIVAFRAGSLVIELGITSVSPHADAPSPAQVQQIAATAVHRSVTGEPPAS